MATSNEDKGNTFVGSKLHIVAIQSVMPIKPTDPRLSYRVQVPETPSPGIFQRRFQTVISYKSLEEEENQGWIMAGWIKESLGRALVEEPVFSGRLKRGGANGELEVVTNDSGARLVEASVEMELSDFLDLDKNQEAEAELVFWENVNEQNPQFFPLFYVQVTNFKCGGYSIGISCSLFLADAFSILRFLEKWSEIHKNIVSSSNNPKNPIFYLPSLRNSGNYTYLTTDSITRAKAGHSMFFSTDGKNMSVDDDKIFKKLAEQCIREAEEKLGRKIESKSLLYLKCKSGNINIENLETDGEDEKPYSNVNGLSSVEGWEYFGAGGKGYFIGENMQAHVSHWINSISDETFVMITTTSSGDDLRVQVIVTIPS